MITWDIGAISSSVNNTLDNYYPSIELISIFIHKVTNRYVLICFLKREKII